jgi:hypothetical protein
MTISEYIEKLVAVREAHGDLEVWAEGSESCPERVEEPQVLGLFHNGHHLHAYSVGYTQEGYRSSGIVCLVYTGSIGCGRECREFHSEVVAEPEVVTEPEVDEPLVLKKFQWAQ